MQCLGAGLEVGDVEPRDRHLRLMQESELFVQRQPTQEIVDALVEWKGWVAEWIVVVGAGSWNDQPTHEQWCGQQGDNRGRL